MNRRLNFLGNQSDFQTLYAFDLLNFQYVTVSLGHETNISLIASSRLMTLYPKDRLALPTTVFDVLNFDSIKC
jgi:hypothetical protein